MSDDESGFLPFYETDHQIKFDLITHEWGYLPQINEKMRNRIQWHVVRIEGSKPEGRSQFKATPLWCGRDMLLEFSRVASSKKAAMKLAAEALGMSLQASANANAGHF